jgi:hypothetical protein
MKMNNFVNFKVNYELLDNGDGTQNLYMKTYQNGVVIVKTDFGNVEDIINLRHENEKLKLKINHAIEYIESNPKVYVDEEIICVNDIIDWENTCEELEFEKDKIDKIYKTEFIKTLLNILKENKDE